MPSFRYDLIAEEFPAHVPRSDVAPGALAGVRVVDFSHFIAGPFATMILADMGADVIKIEPPGRGDDLRHYPPVDPALQAGAPFVWSNRNKRSVALDLKSTAGVEVARALIAQADVLVENFSSGVMRRFGLDDARCRALNPRLVYCSVSAYGREGPYADRLGFDPIAQAESGFVSMNGYPDRLGVRASSAVMDISTAMMACNAVLGALYARTRTGQGQTVEVALYDNAVLMTGWASMQHLFTGEEPKRHGNTSVDTCPSGVFEASDRPFYINCGNDKIFERLARQVLERPDLADDPGLAHREGRRARREELFAVLGEVFARAPWSHWQARMRACGIPCGEVRTVGEALRSPEARARGLVSWLPDPRVGHLPNIAQPIRMSATPIADPVPAPLVGEHTAQVLREALGYDEVRIAQLAAAGAFGAVAGRDAPSGADAARRGPATTPRGEDA